MDYRKKLILYRKLYEHTGTDLLFVNAVKRNTAYHRKHCPEYATILSHQKLNLRKIQTVKDLYRIPVLPNLYLKSHKLHSIPREKMYIKFTSSESKGKKSQIGLDFRSFSYGAFLVLRTAVYHKLISIKPVNYIILGYKPTPNNHTFISKVAYGATLFAPAVHREYALKQTSGGNGIDMKGIKDTLFKFSKQPFPVRLIGFPNYLYLILQELKKDGIQLNLHKDSKVFLGGSWKELNSDHVNKSELYSMIEEYLGIVESNCREFYGVVEHPILYCDCKNHHFHVPSCSRVIIRDVKTLLPVDYGTIGLVNLLTPMIESMPLGSIMTGELGILHDGKECGCGINTPYFEIIERAGIHDNRSYKLSNRSVL